MTDPHQGYEAIVLGASAGGLVPIKELILSLPAGFSLPLIIVQHVAESHDGSWLEHLARLADVRVKEADEKEPILPGSVYFAPGNYHLLVETDRTLSLSTEGRVNYARPSIDVLFETAAEAYRNALVGVILSGGNADGAQGSLRIKELGGLTIVQDPATAETPSMPAAAIRVAHPDHVLRPAQIIELLIAIHRQRPTSPVWTSD